LYVAATATTTNPGGTTPDQQLDDAATIMAEYRDIAPQLLGWATQVRTGGMDGDECGGSDR
jgi:hypothetical protein